MTDVTAAAPEDKNDALATAWRDRAGGETDPRRLLDLCNALIEAGALPLAEYGLRLASARHPENAPLAARFARTAGLRNDWTEAVLRWADVVARFPAEPRFIRALAGALLHVGMPDRAEIVFEEGFARLSETPGNTAVAVQLLGEAARLAEERGHASLARQRWARVRAAQRAEGGPEDAAPPASDRGPLPPAEGPGPHAPLMQCFEGLGGTCEFGLVQRYFGAEPLGLFRWVSLNARNLIRALDSDFDGIGEPGFTTLSITPGGEFSTSDTRYRLAMHTFIKDIGQDREKLIMQLRRRMRFLRDKLLDDLRAGEKIFAYRHTGMPTDADVLALAEAVRRFNPANRLLVARMLPHKTEGEAVHVLAPGVAVCAIGNGRKPESGWDIDYAFWLESLQRASDLLTV